MALQDLLQRCKGTVVIRAHVPGQGNVRADKAQKRSNEDMRHQAWTSKKPVRVLLTQAAIKNKEENKQFLVPDKPRV